MTCVGNVGCTKMSALQWKQRGEQDVMNVIHKKKVACLKMVIFQLQKQNDMLVCELKHHMTEKSKEDVSSHKNSPSNTAHTLGSDPKLKAVWNDLEELKYVVENMILNKQKTEKEFASPEICKSQKIVNLKRKIKQLEKEVDRQKLLRQQTERQIQTLEGAQVQLIARFHKQLKLQKKRVSSEMQALLIKARTKHIESEANLGLQREKQLELYISAMQERFRDVLLNVQARNTKSHHSNRQIIDELEKKLTKSLMIL